MNPWLFAIFAGASHGTPIVSASGVMFMPSKNVMPKFSKGKLHSGSKTGPKVKNPKQAIAIMMSEKRKEKKGQRP